MKIYGIFHGTSIFKNVCTPMVGFSHFIVCGKPGAGLVFSSFITTPIRWILVVLPLITPQLIGSLLLLNQLVGVLGEVGIVL
jgi:hypothetical protein